VVTSALITERAAQQVGQLHKRDPFTDVYSQLYELAGLAEPPAAERTKPPCCGTEDGKPRSRMANSSQTSPTVPASYQGLLNDAHADQRARV
jgi:hypothetical protein